MDFNKMCPGCMHEIENRQDVGKCPLCGYDLTHMTAEPHQLQPFSILAGKYLVGKVIGEGGFGISYIGIDLNLEIIVAIKEFYPNGFVTRESNHSTRVSMYSGKNEADVNKWREGFINEAKNLAKFSNLNGIVEVRDFFNENNTAYIVMEYIDGITLKQYLKQNGGKIPADRTLQMMEPVIRSLSKVHDSGMIHRDISPDNIMITKYGGMKLLDFGAAREFAGNAEKSLSIMLKPGYAPEEQYRSRGKQGPWSDVYALTATIYKCITGVTPVESMERMRDDTLKSPGELGVKLSGAQESAIKQGMAVYAENRIQSMDALHAALYSDQGNSVSSESKSVASVVKEVKEAVQSAGSDAGGTATGGGKMQHMGDAEVKLEISDTQKRTILVGAAAVCGIFLIILCVMLIPKNTDKGGHTASSYVDNTVMNEAGEENNAPQTTAGGSVESQISDLFDGINDTSDADDITDQVNAISSSVTDYSNVEEMGSALDQYLELASQCGNRDNLGEEVYSLFGYYATAMAGRIDNCISQEPSAALYTQISGDLDTSLGYVEQFKNCGIGVNSEELDALNQRFRSNYKDLLISNFDYYADSEIQDNGVVSRSVLWSKMQGIEKTDLYDKNNPEDPLRLRYEAALTLYTDSELESMGDLGSKIGKVYEVLFDTDYSPLLIYYLSQEYGDPNAVEWYETYCALDYYLDYMSDIELRNFVYYYYTDPSNQWIRETFREYMSNEL